MDVSVSPSDAGSILPSASDTHEGGETVELTANPAEGWTFVEWTGDVSGTENPTEITVDDPKEVTAYFEQAQNQAFSLAGNGVTVCVGRPK